MASPLSHVSSLSALCHPVSCLAPCSPPDTRRPQSIKPPFSHCTLLGPWCPLGGALPRTLLLASRLVVGGGIELQALCLGSEGARQPWCREEGVGSGKPETAAAHTLGQRDVNIRGPGSVGRSSEKTGPVNPHPRKVGRGELALELVGDAPPLAYQRHQRGHNWSGDLGGFLQREWVTCLCLTPLTLS